MSVRVNISLTVRDEVIAKEILNLASKGFITWKELVNTYSTRGVSALRLKKIILALLAKNQLVELPCRLFTTQEYLVKTRKDVIKNEVVRKLKELGVMKCGKPLGIPYEKITIRISRNKEVSINFHF